MKVKPGFCLSLAALFWASTALAQEKIVLGNSVHGLHALPVYVAVNKGLFKEQGLNIELVTFQGGATATPALLGGSTHLQAAGTENLLKLIQQGQPVTAVMTIQSTMNAAIMVRPDVAAKIGHKPTLKDLKGLKIATLARGGAADMALRYIAASVGQDAERDWGLTPILGYDKQLAALKAKDIDGSLPIEPVTTIWARPPLGMVPVMEMLKGEGPKIFQDMGWVTLQGKKDWIGQNREAVRKIVGALVQAQKMIANPANSDEVVKLAAISFPNLPQPILAATIAAQVRTYVPQLTEEMIDKNNELLVKTGNLRAPIRYADSVDKGFADLWAEFRK
jgi:NitT/TauT family transport system substrate-binding protein